jgi:potassium-transporting ATPase KdpC subunit
MLNEIRPAVMLLVLLTLITGLAYPLAMTGLAVTLFPYTAEGSLIRRDGQVIGSALIGQEFKSDRYFHGRPSMTTGRDPTDPAKSVVQPYNAINSMASNLGPTNRGLAARVAADVNRLKQENPNMPVPIDLVTTAASGLDPDISPEAAFFQVPRIAKARHLSEDRVRQLIEAQVERRIFGLLGEPRVNVLRLNLALDQVTS